MSKILTCIYRACDLELTANSFRSLRRPYFDKRKCFKSFWDSFNNQYCEIILVWDGDKNNDLYRYVSALPIKIVHMEERGNTPSLLKCYELAQTINTPFGYLIEDDYAHLPNSFYVLIDMFYYSDLVSLYDHPDRYGPMRQQDITLGKEYIYVGKYCHFRTAESTTMSFGFRKETLNKYYSSLVAAAKRGVGAADDRGWWREMVVNGYRLVTPIPALNSHLVKNCESPFINWESYINSIKL